MGRRAHVISPVSQAAVTIVFGVVAGFFLATWSRQSLVPCSFVVGVGGVGTYSGTGCCRVIAGGAGRLQDLRAAGSSTYDDRGPQSASAAASSTEYQDMSNTDDAEQNSIFIGVMTARKYLSSRVVAAQSTWATAIPGKVMFFSSGGSKLEENPEIPIIGLPGVDDAYPPQKKSFLMLKYMHDNFIDKYEWFMRADDDVYIRGDKLAKFLHSINSSTPRFIGQAGLGTKQEFGQLSLDKNENFCMGGPGMIFSRETLKRIAPHISYCLKNLYTTHEDVEVGRCVRKFAGVACTWAFEMQHLFYHNHRESNGSFTHPLKIKEVHRAITLHPVKNHTYQYRLHNYFSHNHIVNKKHKILQLHREIAFLTGLLKDHNTTKSHPSHSLNPSLTKHVPLHKDEVLSWEFLSKSIFSDEHESPRRGLSSHHKVALEDIMMQVMQKINRNARQRGRTIDFKEILYGYRRVDPLHGADWILDLLLVYRKHKGRKMTVPVRRHAYLQQTFTDLEMIEDKDLTRWSIDRKPSATSSSSTAPQQIFKFLQQKLNSLYLTGGITTDNKMANSDESAVVLAPENKIIHFILPLSGRYTTFVHFMQNFEDVCLKGQTKVALAVILYQASVDDRSRDTINIVHKLQSRYPHHSLQVVQMKGSFSRGVALAEGSALFSNDSLLTFIDVDIRLRPSALERIKLSTIYGRQVYYPIVFSQYDPNVGCKGTRCAERTTSNPFHFNNRIGFWRQFGFGIASMYKSDLDYVGGFDTRIQGWGKEDVQLFEKFVACDRRIFRSIDVGMVHIFHAIVCDPNLEAAQYQMCLGTKAATFGSTEQLAEIVYNTPQILTRNEKKLQKEKSKKARHYL